MKVLITGANGFLGRHVVAEFLRRGHAVRALVRPAARLGALGWTDDVELFRGDLRVSKNLADAFEGVDVLVHLAAAVAGGEDAQFAAGVVGTERLLDAMARAETTRRLVLASSFSVYDWSAIRGALTEASPLEAGADLYDRDGYAVAKAWQERVARRAAREHGWALTVLRPGFIWGRGNEYLACLGQKVGPVHLVFGPRSRVPLTHVENCADLFATAAEHPGAVGETFNVVDGDDVRVWSYLGDYLRRSGGRGVRVPVPYALALAGARLARRVSRWTFRGKGKLPSILVPCRFEARFKPLRFGDGKARELLGWRPPLDYRECLRRTYGGPPRGMRPFRSRCWSPPMPESATLAVRGEIGDAMTIGYLTSVYARPGDLFIRGEVAQLRALGYAVRTFSVRRPEPGELVSDEIRREHAATEYLLDAGPARIALAGLRGAIRSPRRWLDALRLAARIGAPGLKGRLWPFFYLLEGAYLAGRLEAAGVRRLHNHIGENSASVAMFASHFGGVPFSMTIHGPSEFDRPESLALGEKIGRASFVATVCEYGRSQLFRWCDYRDWAKIHVVRSGVERKFLEGGPRPIPDTPRLISIGRLAEAKGQLLLVEAAARLAAEGLRFELVLVGDGPMRGPIERLIDEHGLDEHVRLAGWMSSDRVRDEILKSRALVMASFAEGLPMVLMETLALGRPVVGTYVAGIPELVRPGECGWLVPPGSVDALADAMREALSAPVALLERLGRAGASLVAERHDPAVVAAEMAALIERSAAETHRAPDARGVSGPAPREALAR